MSASPEQAHTDTDTQAAVVEVEYFSDPLCCWSWALEPQWRRLRFEFGPLLSWRYRMGGMISDWDAYDDPINSISRPSQMAPLWYQARELSGMPLEDRIWLEDPPRSSYPACAAFKAAELQSSPAAELYLRRLREAAMMGRQNIARPEVLLAIAGEVQQQLAPEEFDAGRFANDFNASEALDAFREDLRLSRYMNLERYPTLIFRGAGQQRGLCLTGYRPYASLRAALQRVYQDQVSEEMQPTRELPSPQQYAEFWGGALQREIRELGAAAS